MRKILIGLYGFGLVQIIILSSYHFYLPTHTQWGLQMQGASAMMGWSLFLLNFGWSAMTLIVAASLLVFLFKPSSDSRTKQWLATAFLLYWIVHTARIFLVAAPVPPSMSWINTLIQGFSVQIVILLVCGPIVFRNQTRA